MQANAGLTQLLRETIGDGFLDKLDLIADLNKYADDAGFQEKFAEVKRANKVRLASAIRETLGISVDPGALFDVQVKRIHEYKRQLLNILEAVALYDQIRAHPEKNWTPRVKIFGGKAAPSYWQAKLIIHLINDVARIVNSDPAVHGLLKIVFMPNYNVSLAEVIIPAADLSEQISTAGLEASGTGNMKFMMNGALTIGTLDGANVEILEHVGADNIVIFGLTADEVEERRRTGHNPRSIIGSTPQLAEALDTIAAGVFSPEEPGRYKGLVDNLMTTDWFLVTADYAAYVAAQRSIDAIWQDKRAWYGKTIRNTANVAWFSADRTISEYARDIWGVPCSIGAMKGAQRREAWRLDAAAIAAIVSGTHADPFAVLGPHQFGDDWVERAFVPGAERLSVADAGYLEQRDPAGFFEGLVKLPMPQALRLNAANAGGTWSLIDPYSFGPILGPMDDYYSAEGTHLRLFDKLGAHVLEHEGSAGVHFAVWAPSAKRVSVVGDFNQWDGRRHIMRRRTSGVWEIFLPEIGPGTVYKFEIVGANGKLLPLKADPLAFQSEVRPKTPRLSPIPALTHGTMTSTCGRGRSITAARRCRFTRCTSARGGGAATAASSPTTRSPTS